MRERDANRKQLPGTTCPAVEPMVEGRRRFGGEVYLSWERREREKRGRRERRGEERGEERRGGGGGRLERVGAWNVVWDEGVKGGSGEGSQQRRECVSSRESI